MTRSEIQTFINKLRGTGLIRKSDLFASVSSWLDSQDLEVAGLDKDFVKTHILEDLGTYEGVVNEEEEV